jgi:geranylgeranyl pyrophosphate synthase
MSFDRMKERVLAIPQVAAWPEMVEMIQIATHQDWRSLWDYPFIACRAMGRDAADAIPGAAAVFCSLASIHLVDDILDQDDQGLYHSLGVGPTANMALAFQAAAHLVLEEVKDAETRALLQDNIAAMSLATALGQHFDATREVSGEEDYWRVVHTKTPPLFGTALFLGALLGGASPETARQIERLGGAMGVFIQVSDDLSDALKVPAGTDWRRRTNNLPILYALTAEHPEREEFSRLAERAGEPEALAEAQRILLRSGAVSYCALKLIELSRLARGILAEIALPEPGPLRRLIEMQLKPLDHLFRSVGVDTPAALLLD